MSPKKNMGAFSALREKGRISALRKRYMKRNSKSSGYFFYE